MFVFYCITCSVVYVCIFCGDQVFVCFVSFLFMIIYEVVYTWCLRHGICSALILDTRISTCCSSDQSLHLLKFKIFVLNFSLFTFYITLYISIGSYMIICLAMVEAQICYPRHVSMTMWYNVPRVTGIHCVIPGYYPPP